MTLILQLHKSALRRPDIKRGKKGKKGRRRRWNIAALKYPVLVFDRLAMQPLQQQPGFALRVSNPPCPLGRI